MYQSMRDYFNKKKCHFGKSWIRTFSRKVALIRIFIDPLSPPGEFSDGNLNVRGSFEKFVDWRQYTAVMQREAMTVMPSCGSGDNIVVT